jgi:hypothetical protein
MVVWGCLSKDRTYAVCASPDLTTDRGYIKYRAKRNDKVEFEYPATMDNPQDLFSFSLLAKGAMLSFTSNDHLYQLFEGLMGDPSIDVSQGSKEVARIDCSSGSFSLTQTDVQGVLKNAGIGE